ncbi:MAG: DUF2996 domain-containing protein [Thermostichales cyanobacterium SZTDM-1c_bins_54]
MSEPTPVAAKGKKPAAKVEKPFAEAIQEDLIPMTQAAFAKRGVTDLVLEFSGKVLSGKFGSRSFQVVFAEESLEGAKFFTCSTDGIPAGTWESFMIDERKPGPDLISFYIVQRLFAQQWL